MGAASKALCDNGVFLTYARTDQLFDDFAYYVSTDLWTTVSTNSGTVAFDGTNGTTNVLCTTGTTEGNFSWIRSTNAIYLPVQQHPMSCATRLYNFTNQATTNAWVGFGFASTTTITATSELDPTASMSSMLIYKRKGDSVWSAQSSNGATKTTSLSVNPAVTGGTYDLRIDLNDFDGSNAEVSYMVNGVYLQDSNGKLIKHTVAYASLAAMFLIAGCLAGTTAAQLAYFDYLGGQQLRAGLN